MPIPDAGFDCCTLAFTCFSRQATCSTEESRERYLSTLTLYEEILALVTDPTLLVDETTSNRAVREREVLL